jgi:3-oxo-5-alpha-steroid 4-dehydrogenase 3
MSVGTKSPSTFEIFLWRWSVHHSLARMATGAEVRMFIPITYFSPMFLSDAFDFVVLLFTSIMDPAQLCKIFFSIGTAVNLGGTLIPSFRERIMNYGSRSTSSRTSPPERASSNLFEYIASFEVPHTWFTHYYFVSTASSLFWAQQILTHGQVFQFLAAHSPATTSGSMTANQVLLAWALMSIQGSRRLYESITLTKPSKSKMWVGLWAIGIAYYIAMGISVWIEGIRP